MIRIGVTGASGRMGRAIARLARADPDLAIAALIERADSPAIGTEIEGALVTSDVRAPCDVLIDFSHASATASIVKAATSAKRPLVVGTTGLPEPALVAIGSHAAVAPVVHAPNMSAGVTLLFELAAQAARVLGPDYDAEIVEMHHRHKRDAPSGTAARLAEVVARAKGLGPDAIVHGRSGEPGARPQQEIGVFALRGGDVVGDHTLVLAADGERLELGHRATSRDVFARGALRAAKWVASAPPGLYDMRDVLGLAR
jgi:4-hydroxy-tetrahydrodipicolinate reductase